MILRAFVAVIVLWAGPLFAACSPDHLAVRGDGLSANFTVELAVTPEEKARGLMFRDQMPPFHGMLFVYQQPQRVSFWMRNTLISLDMVFIDAAGIVRSVHANAVPHDETGIPGGFDDIQYVLEINGGLAAMLGLTVGSQIQHPVLDQTLAAWPCE